MYEVNYIVNLVNVFVINKFYELEMFGKIGLSFVYMLNYLIDSNFENVLVVENVEDLMVNYWMDVYMWGKYFIVVMRFLEEKGWVLMIVVGDVELLELVKLDFFGINYY